MTPLFMHNFMKSSKIFFSNFKWGIVRTKDESLKKKERKKKKKKASSPISLRINT